MFHCMSYFYFASEPLVQKKYFACEVNDNVLDSK